MTIISVLLTELTELFETFVSFIRYDFITYGIISLLFTNGLFSNLFVL
jgi:hypothetical protein